FLHSLPAFLSPQTHYTAFSPFIREKGYQSVTFFDRLKFRCGKPLMSGFPHLNFFAARFNRRIICNYR
ncbi:hypothetical protein, partial [Anaeromassilibacillus sp. An200]|uniref:hypothetical protein n=1 Tax=Anaeromassilibacillus sp. An200 TaxID=1965587 RepID=UPI0019D2978C